VLQQTDVEKVQIDQRAFSALHCDPTDPVRTNIRILCHVEAQLGLGLGIKRVNFKTSNAKAQVPRQRNAKEQAPSQRKAKPQAPSQTKIRIILTVHVFHHTFRTDHGNSMHAC